MIYALIEIADADILEIYILHALFTKNTFLYFLQFTAHHFSQFKSQCVLYLLLQHTKLSFLMSSFMPIANKETDFKCIIAQLALILVKVLSAVLPSRGLPCSLDRTIRMVVSVCLKGFDDTKWKRIILFSAYDWFGIWSQFKYIDNQAIFARTACVGRISVWLRDEKKILSAVHIDIFISACRILRSSLILAQANLSHHLTVNRFLLSLLYTNWKTTQ